MSEFRCLKVEQGQRPTLFETVPKCIEYCIKFLPVDYAWAGSSARPNQGIDPRLWCSCLTDAEVKITPPDSLCKPCAGSEDATAGYLCGEVGLNTTLAAYSIPGRLPKKPADPPISSQNPRTTQIPTSPSPSIAINSVDQTSIIPTSASSSVETNPTSNLETITSSMNGTDPAQTSASIFPPATNPPSRSSDTPSSEFGNGGTPVVLIAEVTVGVVVTLVVIWGVVWIRRQKIKKAMVVAEVEAATAEPGAEVNENQPQETQVQRAPSFGTDILLLNEPLSTLIVTLPSIGPDIEKDAPSALWQYINEHERNVPFSHEDLKKDPELYTKGRDAVGDGIAMERRRMGGHDESTPSGSDARSTEFNGEGAHGLAGDERLQREYGLSLADLPKYTE
ncbi:hypothetical protein HDU97_001471 [Phlyctochytrium planicorne]|nr:hypothetical protein HDU97_001471 [Phlyctochytrium planicorne]